MTRYMLIVSETAPGFVRPADIDVLESLVAVAASRNAHHLASALRGMARGLRNGHAVTVDTKDA